MPGSPLQSHDSLTAHLPSPAPHRGAATSSAGLGGTSPGRWGRAVVRASCAVVLVSWLAGCSALGALNAVTPQASQAVQTGVAYGPLARQQLDLYQPQGASPQGGWPVVVFFYGGSWNSGERADYRFVGEALAGRGVLALVADYRLYPQVRYPDFLQDSAQAVAWGLRNAHQWGGNPSRLFVMGHSAGAYNAAMLALDARWLRAAGHDPSELAGWIGLAGPYDFLPTNNMDAQPVFFHPDYPANAQPIDWVPSAVVGANVATSASVPPTFVAAPERDVLVSPERSTRQLADKLKAAGVAVTHKSYGRVNHVTMVGALGWPLRWLAPVLDDVSQFIEATAPVTTARAIQAPRDVPRARQSAVIAP